MKLIFMLHCPTIEWEKWIILGSLDWNLDTNSVEEYKDFCREINKKYSPELIISSSLKRAIDSAKIFQEISKKEIIINPLCNERKSWVAEWKNINEIDWESYERLPISKRKHKWWESFKEVKERAKKFLEEIKKHSKDTIIIISHSVFILMIIAETKKIPIKEALKISLKERFIEIININPLFKQKIISYQQQYFLSYHNDLG